MKHEEVEREAMAVVVGYLEGCSGVSSSNESELAIPRQSRSCSPASRTRPNADKSKVGSLKMMVNSYINCLS